MSEIAAVENLMLSTPEGAPVRLGDLWKERPAVLVWVRHYG